MPWTPPAIGIKRTPSNFETPLKAFVDGVETTATSALSTAQTAQATAAQKYTKPAQGIPTSDLASEVTALFGAVAVREYVGGAWQVRGSVGASTVVLWIKRVSTQPDPAIDATYFKQGVDILLKAA